MIYCDCPEWEPNIVKVNAPLQLAYARNPTAANMYRGVPFRYCPWCGTELKGFFEHAPASSQETEGLRYVCVNPDAVAKVETSVVRCNHGVPIDPAIPCEHCGSSPMTTCLRCGATVNIREVKPDGWIDVEPHACRGTRCPTCDSPEPHRHPTGGFGEPTRSCKDPWHTPALNRGV